ncbi:lectin-like [Benincasa hispida]|uniref:lectin-like n=1 Tax=Benincasa hispida TaxID=102211 RepID=UPI0019013156|nr:lectin-like [Benincasa hispida]
MGSGWSEEQPQAAQPPQQPATVSAALRSNEHDSGNSSNNHFKEEKEKMVKGKLGEVKLGHGFEDILKDADLPVDRSSLDKLHEQLYAGIFLNKRTKKYWLDKKLKSNCFMLFPRALSITWAEENKYWRWKSMEESSNTIEVIELLNVCWLEIHGKMKTCELSPGILYEAAFEVMIKEPAYGWDIPVNIRLKKPDGSKQERKENLEQRPRGQWVEIPICDFVVHDHERGGEIEFSMYEYEGGMWKKGMLLKGVVIRSKGSI